MLSAPIDAKFFFALVAMSVLMLAPRAAAMDDERYAVWAAGGYCELDEFSNYMRRHCASQYPPYPLEAAASEQEVDALPPEMPPAEIPASESPCPPTPLPPRTGADLEYCPGLVDAGFCAKNEE